MRTNNLIWPVMFSLVLLCPPVAAQQTEGELDASENEKNRDDTESGDVVDYGTMDLKGLLTETKVVTATSMKETLLDAPASMVVITEEDIIRRGYSSMADVLYDLPGFDVMFTNGTNYVIGYQRGYRTPWMQRTLLLVDGKVDNHLWTHVGELSRQYPLSNVKRVEVLYGPASAIYGPNAFLGIINIVTKDGREMDSGQVSVTGSVETGSFDTISLDAGVRGRSGDFTFALSGRIFRSDEPDLSDTYGWLSSDLFADRDIWGPMLDLENKDVSYGKYYDPTDDWGVMGSIGYKGLKVGFMTWAVREAYGPYYAADRVQNNRYWDKYHTTLYAEYEGEISDSIRSKSLLLYRESDINGGWVEATPDWNEGMENYSYISDTQWHALNNSWLFKEKVEVDVTDELQILGGFKYERKELTKAYDIPGYWNVYSSTVPSSDPGPYGSGAGIGHSTDETYERPPLPASEMPWDNLVLTDDLGGFVMGVYAPDPFKFTAGVRYDHNSVYGGSVNPRVSAVYKFSEKGAVKLLYGEAFQEPAPVQLWGGWTGRASNTDLLPEKGRSGEIVAMYQFPYLFSAVSVYYSKFENVIMEQALNLGTRDVIGGELQLQSQFPNPIPNSPDVRAYAYYTFTHVESARTYDFDTGEWVMGDTELGDIAPHKLNLGLSWPILEHFMVHLRGNFVSERTLYAANPLRRDGVTLDPYFNLNLAISAIYDPLILTFKVHNLAGSEYFHPGVERADAGEDFSGRSAGFMNSRIPQPGRYYMLKLTARY